MPTKDLPYWVVFGGGCANCRNLRKRSALAMLIVDFVEVARGFPGLIVVLKGIFENVRNFGNDFLYQGIIGARKGIPKNLSSQVFLLPGSGEHLV